MTESIVLITGGAGFIGSNLAHTILKSGRRVRIFDNLSRKGTERNLAWLQEQFPKGLEFVRGDTRDFPSLRDAVKGVDAIFHLAAQVAVTTSLIDPRSDFETNAMGTFNLLEAARTAGRQPAILFTSTNKVYGGMEDVAVLEKETRYEFRDYPNGITESQPLDFHSPYGCSKGAADQYIHDYFRIYDLPTVIFRMSCIYGTRQFGTEDQGWVAHFIIAATFGKSITIYGNGKQVRDILWVEDLIQAFLSAIREINNTAGQVFNVGGGIENTISIWAEFFPLLEKLIGHPIPVQHGEWRPGDQLIYVSDNSKIRNALGWQPTTTKEQGVEKLYRWVIDHQSLFSR